MYFGVSLTASQSYFMPCKDVPFLYAFHIHCPFHQLTFRKVYEKV